MRICECVILLQSRQPNLFGIEIPGGSNLFKIQVPGKIPDAQWGNTEFPIKRA